MTACLVLVCVHVWTHRSLKSTKSALLVVGVGLGFFPNINVVCLKADLLLERFLSCSSCGVPDSEPGLSALTVGMAGMYSFMALPGPAHQVPFASQPHAHTYPQQTDDCGQCGRTPCALCMHK